MDARLISQAARLTGFTPSALRFYEKEGLVDPDRSASGYRLYDDRTIRTLRLIKRAKALGIPLTEISTLVEMLEEDRCGALRRQVAELVSDRVRQVNNERAEMQAYLNRLVAAVETMRSDRHVGPCDDGCGCLAESDREAAGAASARLAVECSLTDGDQARRLSEWQRVVAGSLAQMQLPDGVRLTLPENVDVARLAELAAAERRCCPGLHFRIELSSAAVTLEVSGPGVADITTTLMGPSFGRDTKPLKESGDE